jgi:hypothetical protein
MNLITFEIIYSKLPFMPTLTKNQIQFDKKNLDDKVLLELYYNMLRPRLIEEKMLILLRQGKNFQMVFRNWPGSNCGWSHHGT